MHVFHFITGVTVAQNTNNRTDGSFRRYYSINESILPAGFIRGCKTHIEPHSNNYDAITHDIVRPAVRFVFEWASAPMHALRW